MDKIEQNKTFEMEIYTPGFSGFYESIWLNGYSISDQLDDLTREEEEKLYPCIDFEGYYKAVGNGYCKEYTKLLNALGFNVSLKYISMFRPKAYNYMSDKIEANIVIPNVKSFTDLLVSKITENFEELQALIIKDFKSYPILKKWIQELKSGSLYEVKVSYLLHFLLLLEFGEDYEYIIYEELNGNGVTLLDFCTFDFSEA